MSQSAEFICPHYTSRLLVVLAPGLVEIRHHRQKLLLEVMPAAAAAFAGFLQIDIC